MLAIWNQRLHTALDRFVPRHLDAEVRRRSFLFIAFSLQGVVFGLLFAAFYLAIGHRWGAVIVLVCTFAMAGAPWIVRAGGLEKAGNVYAGVLTLGFTGLTAIEGGIHGHAVAWLAVVPLCACILVDQRMGRFWCAVCLGIMGMFCVLDLAGVAMHPFYAPRWEGTVTAAGYLTLTLFMGLIGIFFERGRRHALSKLQGVLDELSAANVRLHELDKERTAFLDIAAHDLRSPLNAIMGFTQLLRDFGTNYDAMQQDSIARILTASTRMRDLLDQFLSAEAIKEGKIKLRRDPCDLAVLTGAVVESQRAGAQAKGIALVFEPRAGLGPVAADPEATVQILENLLSNAIKFSPPSRPVTVRVLPAGEVNANGSSTATPTTTLNADTGRRLRPRPPRCGAALPPSPAHATHPHHMPGQHHDREQQRGSIEDLLPRTVEQLSNVAGEHRHHARPRHSGRDARRYLAHPPRHSSRRREHDANDQPGLDGLPEYDDEGRKHG